MPDFKKLKQQLSLSEVFAHYGIFPDKEDGHIHCPWGSEKTASLHYNFGKNRFCCFSSGIKGDILNFIQHKEHCTLYEAGEIAQRILEKTPVSEKKYTSKKPVTQKKVEISQVTPPISAEKFVEVLEAVMELCSLPEKILEKYLLSNEKFKISNTVYKRELGYAITEEDWYTSPHFRKKTIQKFRVGYMGTKYADMRNVLLKKFSKKELCAVGIFQEDKSGKIRLANHFQGRILYPFFRNGRIVHIIGRKTEYSKTEGKYSNCATHPEVNSIRILNEDILKNCKYVLITEGVTDCIKANEAGIDSISPVTTHFTASSYQYLAEKLKRKKVAICFDSERNGSGEKGAREVQKQLKEHGVFSKILLLPLPEEREKIDVCELINEHGKDVFYDFLPAI